MKAKKFTAAEKHFQKIIDSKNKTIKLLESQLNNTLDSKYKLMTENEDLKSKLNNMTAELNELREITGLSEDEIKTLVRKAKGINMALNLINSQYTGEYNI